MGQIWSGCTVDVYGSMEDYEMVNKEHFIGIMNHKYEIGIEIFLSILFFNSTFRLINFMLLRLAYGMDRKNFSFIMNIIRQILLILSFFKGLSTDRDFKSKFL